MFPQEALQLNLQGLVYQVPHGSPSLLAPHLRVGDLIQPDTLTLELLAVVKRSQLVGHNRTSQTS